MKTALALCLSLALAGCATGAATVARITIHPVMPMLVENPTMRGHCVTGGVQLAGAVEIASAICYRGLAADSAVVDTDASADGNAQ